MKIIALFCIQFIKHRRINGKKVQLVWQMTVVLSDDRDKW